MKNPDVTLLLQQAGQGDKSSEAKLLELVYAELKKLAANQMRRERKDHTLRPSALVNEAYLKLLAGNECTFENRAHFYAAAARVMRNILIDYARSRAADRRGNAPARTELKEDMITIDENPAEFLELNDALDRLAKLDERQAKVVELRFFGGLSVEETAAAMHMSEKTVKRDWAVARAWLEAELTENPK